MLGLILVTLLVGGAAFYFFREITWKEFLLQIGACSLLLFASYNLAKCSMLADTEYLNGRITKKAHGTESCCHCREVCDSRDKDGKCTSSHTVCDHFQDYWWALDTTVGRIGVRDCSGSSRAPKVWTNARVGEPATVASYFKNYLRADKESIIRHDVDLSGFMDRVPKFPGVHSLYKRNPVVTDGVKVPAKLVKHIQEFNADNGALKQVDVVVVLTSAKSSTYAQAVEAKWLYGPKNAFTVVLGVTPTGHVGWARAVTFSKVEELKLDIRDDLKAVPLAETGPIITELVSAKFKRTPMSDYEYLEKSLTLSTGWTIALYILAILLAVGISVYMHAQDVFGDEYKIRRRWR